MYCHEISTMREIQVISYKANAMKNAASVEELLKFANGILKLHGQEGSAPCS